MLLWIIFYLHVLFKGPLFSDASAPATAKICAFNMLLLQDEKVEAWIGVGGIIFT
jgi:hypothetical protein